MRIESKKTVKVDELAELIPFRAGATFSQLWQILYYTRLFKYVHRQHYQRIKPAYNKICTSRNLKKLCDLGYFKTTQKDIFCATDKVLPILNEAGFITETLPQETVGKGDINELNNTEVMIKLLKYPDFHTFVFPNFGYIIPDSLLVQRNHKQRKYKLTFIEIERKKSGWQEYIQKKHENYLKLSKDLIVYRKWCEYCDVLGIDRPKHSSFKFSVLFICDINLDLGKGFRFERI